MILNQPEKQTSTIVAEEKSTHECPVFKLGELKPHFNADKLKVIDIEGTDYKYCANYDDWKDYSGLVAWIPPDSLVDYKKEQFTFLAAEPHYLSSSEKNESGDYVRIKAKKLRCVNSYGLLVKVNDLGLNEGDDAANILGVVHYEPPIAADRPSMTGEACGGPSKGVYPKYDVDAGMKYARKVFTPGEKVYVFEKLDGSNSKFVFVDGEMFCGSRTEWKREFALPPKLNLEDLISKVGEEKAKEIYEAKVNNHKPKKNLWWQVVEKYSGIRKFCEENPEWSLWGEVYGVVNRIKYSNELLFGMFDVRKPDGTWLNPDEMIEISKKYDIPHAPLVAIEDFDFDKICAMCEGKSLINDKVIREGIVVSPAIDRWDHKLGRVKVKFVNPEFLGK